MDDENFGQTVSIELRPGGKETRVTDEKKGFDLLRRRGKSEKEYEGYILRRKIINDIKQKPN